MRFRVGDEVEFKRMPVLSSRLGLDQIDAGERGFVVPHDPEKDERLSANHLIVLIQNRPPEGRDCRVMCDPSFVAKVDCDGMCVTGADVGIGVYGVAYPHPGCPAHAPGEVCGCGDPERCLSPTHGRLSWRDALEIRHRQNPADPRAPKQRPEPSTCKRCDGEGCEEGCGRRGGCEHVNAGPDSHKICSGCHGQGYDLDCGACRRAVREAVDRYESEATLVSRTYGGYDDTRRARCEEHR